MTTTTTTTTKTTTTRRGITTTGRNPKERVSGEDARLDEEIMRTRGEG